MAFGPVLDLSKVSVDPLYDLYVEIAVADHAFRVQSQYGSTPPPPGHCEFRPLSRQAFTQRVLHYDSLPGNIGLAIRQRLSRQSLAYGIDATPYSQGVTAAA